MSGDDYCTVPQNDTYLAYTRNSGLPVTAYPLSLCEGDFDKDIDCEQGLYCYKRSGFDCYGLGAHGKDYCIHT